MDVLEKAKEMERKGIDIVHLEVGEPDFSTPQCVNKAAIDAINNGKTHYTHSLGLIELREAICRHYDKKYSVKINPQQIMVTSGTSPAMFMLFSQLLDPGDEIIIPDPHYACYPNYIKFAGGVPVSVRVYEEDGFQYTSQNIKKKITDKTKGIFVNSPSNPTGNVISGEKLKEISELSKYIISDEIYHGLVYEGEEHSILEYTDKAFVLNGFSKLYAMTGWRLGYLIAPEDFISQVQTLQQNFFICGNAMVQWAGISALENTEADIKKMKETYNKRRLFMIKRLREIGFRITVEPTGAFYILANAQHLSGDSYRLAFDILEKARVGVTPGIDFGMGAEGYLRFSYANSLKNIEEGMNRLEEYVNNFKETSIK
ncbi:MAG: pyridoxal phosphate-dependent aminotransferase [Spirochaetes bacterium]|nr:pyridoxal phosphate-dependent aminotransferase [Spirochaetota bacterium]